MTENSDRTDELAELAWLRHAKGTYAAHDKRMFKLGYYAARQDLEGRGRREFKVEQQTAKIAGATK